jgi:hypothetical protein
MSKGPGRVQRAILDAISTPEAAAPMTYANEKGYPSDPGPVGVPLKLIFASIYGSDSPTRAQRHSVWRALRVLHERGEVEYYQRRACFMRDYALAGADSYPCVLCGWSYGHPPVQAVGRPRTDEEDRLHKSAMATALAMLRALS